MASRIRKKVFRLPKRLLTEMDARALVDGYQHNRARWIREAYRGMVASDPEFMRVGAGERIYGRNDAMITLTGPDEFWEDLHEGAMRLRELAPLFGGPMSALIRSAIVYRLNNRKPFSQAE